MFFKRIYALIVKEFLAVWQDKKSRFVLIGPPLIQLFIFAFAATLDVKNVSIAILNKDEGKLAYELTQRFQGSPIFTHVKYLNSVHQIREEIDDQNVVMTVQIDAQFSRNILSGKTAEVELILDGRKSNTSQIVQGYAIKIINQYAQDLAQQMNLPTPGTILIPRNYFNPNLIYTWFTVPGLVVLLTMITSLIITALSIARERELGTFDQLLVSPLRPFDILLGKTIPGVLLGLGEGTLILIAAVLAFHIPFTGSLLALYLSMFVFVLSVVGIGLFLSSLCSTQQQALLAAFVFMSIMITLSGFATPIENMPLWLQKFMLINPIRFCLIIARGVFLKDLPFADIWNNLYPMILIAIFNLTTATWLFRRRLE